MLAFLFAAALVGKTLAGPAVALDGNTLMITGPKSDYPQVRLFGLAAQEMDDRLGPAARAALDDMIAGRPVACTVTDRESRGRLVALCSAGDDDLSEAVLRTGLATADRVSTHAWHADPAVAARLDAAEAAARSAGLGIWATTAASETDWWEDFRWVQILISAGTAFAGFFVATRYNHKLTMKRDEGRRDFEAEQAKAEKDQARRVLAAELHAELPWVMKMTRHNIMQIKQEFSAEADDGDEMQTDKWQWQIWLPPPMVVLESHVGQLGLLPQEVANDLIDVGGVAAWLGHFTAALIAGFEGPKIPINVVGLWRLVRQHEHIVRRLVGLNVPLAELAGVEPHDWAAIEVSLAAEKVDAKVDDAAAAEEDGDAAV